MCKKLLCNKAWGLVRSLSCFVFFPVIAGMTCPPTGNNPSGGPGTVKVNPSPVVVPGSADFVNMIAEVQGAQAGARFRYVWQLPPDALGGLEDQNGPVPALGTEQASVNYVLKTHTAQQVVKLETLGLVVFEVNADGSNGRTVGSVNTEVTILPKTCDGSAGTPVFTGCGLNSTWPTSVRMGEEMTITFRQQSGGICGGTWTIRMNMPGEFTSAPGGTISTQAVSFPDPGATTTRTAVFRLGANAFDYAGKRLCPRGLGYYEFPSADTGPYIYITNGAHDLLPFVVNP